MITKNPEDLLASNARPLPGEPQEAPVRGISPGTAHRRVERRTTLAARGEPSVWLLSAAQIGAIFMIIGLLALIFYQGFRTFWPKSAVFVTLKSGEKYLGEVTREELYRPAAEGAHGASDAEGKAVTFERRQLIRTGNFDLYGDDFKWVSRGQVAVVDYPADATIVERLEWGIFVGFVEAFQVDGKPVTDGREAAWERFQAEHARLRARHERIAGLQRKDISDINYKLEAHRLELRKVELERGKGSPEYKSAQERLAKEDAALRARHDELAAEVGCLQEEDGRTTVLLSEIGGSTKAIRGSEIVRAYKPNAVSFFEKLRIYLSRWWEFLSQEPREANTEGGVFPAIFGTVSMTLLMALAVAPLGIVAALYLREYARQGLVVSLVRIAVNNLAGVPSIVFGVFGLGFFCYVVGGTIDQVFFSERLPSPTFGTGGLLWASLTLALMTVPVVIVATEEALAAVPRSMREGGYGCGASKWQVIRRIVLPKATPGILTGIVLAMARGAGEVAPLMITGVVKLAPELAIDGHFPFIHLERSFMHLGFHIYDVGFQSRNAEAAKPMVFTATLLLICLVLLMNVSVIGIRAKLKRKYAEGQF